MDGSPTITLAVSNVLGPGDKSESLVAVLDTGYSGFLLLSEQLFERLGFSDLRVETSSAALADGRRVTLRSAYGMISVQGSSLEAAGAVQTLDGAEETLVGMDALRGLAVTLDTCAGESSARRC